MLKAKSNDLTQQNLFKAPASGVTHRKFISTFRVPAGSAIVTSSCRGVCTWAREAAGARGLVVKTYSPDLTQVRDRIEMVERYYERNRQLITACDIVHAFISQEGGLTGGTKFEVQYAKRLGKEVFLHWENSIVQRIGQKQKALPFGQSEKNFAGGWLKFFSEAFSLNHPFARIYLTMPGLEHFNSSSKTPIHSIRLLLDHR